MLIRAAGTTMKFVALQSPCTMPNMTTHGVNSQSYQGMLRSTLLLLSCFAFTSMPVFEPPG